MRLRDRMSSHSVKRNTNRGTSHWKSLNYVFIHELKAFILTTPIKPNDPCTNNGCMNHLERIKKMVKWAYEMQFMDRNAFGCFKIKKKRYESKVLSFSQLTALENKSLQRPMLRLVRDLFIFSCYTGMVFSLVNNPPGRLRSPGQKTRLFNKRTSSHFQGRKLP